MEKLIQLSYALLKIEELIDLTLAYQTSDQADEFIGSYLFWIQNKFQAPETTI